uniref:Calcineurin-like phosphoesterase domain-containing protein n=1 Tax=Salix viminalis TaxID=40686 RepID=A0A6N2KIX6_SALVM
MKQRHKLTLVLCGIWVFTLLYGEMFAFWLPFQSSCSWPHLSSPPTSTINGIQSPSDYVKVAVVADQQLMDKTSIGLSPKSFLLETVMFYTDLYMRRAFFASILPFKPDVVLFLGDYFDGGAFLSDEEWQESLHRFKHIFGLNDDGILRNIKVYFIPGNHDVGYASISSHNPKVIERYEGEFGIRNRRFTIGKVEFVAVDSQAIDGRLQGNLASVSWEFIKNVSIDVQLLPRVLLSHIPLYRRDYTYCGPHRSSPIINQRITYSAHNHEIVYQNYLTEESSNQLLDMIKPALVLSGHDHDQCTVTHESKFGPVKEHTVGTLSWQMGNLYPSFMLLSASNSASSNISAPEAAVMTQLYLSLFAVTLLTLLFWPTSGVDFGHHSSDLMASIRLYSSMFKGTKEKSEDEDCEYEMMWDAEGSMHLVKKARVTPLLRPSDKSSVERGNAVMRPAARKNDPQEMEVSMNIDINADTGFDKLTHRTSKSKTKIIIHRLVMTFQMVTVIAVVDTYSVHVTSQKRLINYEGDIREEYSSKNLPISGGLGAPAQKPDMDCSPISIYATARWLIITLNIPAKKHGGATAEDVDTSTLLLHQGGTLIGEAMPLGSPCSRGLLGSSTALVVYLELNLTHI